MQRPKSLPVLLALAAALLLASESAAQGSRNWQTRRVVDLGRYVVATKTWVPENSSFLGSVIGDSLYDNTCLPQTVLGVPEINTISMATPTEIFADTAQIPSTSNTVLPGTADEYIVTGFRWAVCPDEPVGTPMVADMYFLETMGSCEAGGTPGANAQITSWIQVTGLTSPGTGSGICFVFDVDLVGSGLEFPMKADGDGVFDGPLVGEDLDTCGVAMRLRRQDNTPLIGSDNAFGLAGDPGTNIFGFGCQTATGAPGPGGFIGESTAFLNPTRHVDGSTGLGTDDFLESVNGPMPGPTCFFIAGGYALSSAGNPVPYASLHCEIYGVPNSPSVFTDWCNGDGGDQMGCTDCPCGNQTAPGTVGGCLNSTGSGARLIPSGSPSVALGDLRIEATGGVGFALAVLLSGDGVAPGNMANPCFGLNSGIQFFQFDGLRCAVQNTLRHGSRVIAPDGTVGITSPGWGPPNGPPVGIPAQGGFVAGQSRYFQAIYRDFPTAVCMRALNTTQAVQVDFVP